MGDSWEDDEWETADLKLEKKEEETWSDEEGHDAHKQPDPVAIAAATPAPPAPPKPKTGLALKIEEREKREAEEAERKAALRKEMQAGEDVIEVSDGDKSEFAEKLRRKKLEEDADLDSAIDAFGLADSPKKAAEPKKAAAEPAAPSEPSAAISARGERPLQPGQIEACAPVKDAEFEAMAALMNKKLAEYEGKKGHIVAIKALLRAATANMSTDECKDLAAFMGVISNDKIKADREKDKKGQKKKVKGKINISASKASDHDFDDMGGGGGPGWSGGGGGRDDDYDFM